MHELSLVHVFETLKESPDGNSNFLRCEFILSLNLVVQLTTFQ